MNVPLKFSLIIMYINRTDALENEYEYKIA